MLTRLMVLIFFNVIFSLAMAALVVKLLNTADWGANLGAVAVVFITFWLHAKVIPKGVKWALHEKS